MTSIGYYAFYGCSGLTTIIIGNGIKTIYAGVFAKCLELTDVFCYAENVPSMIDGNNIPTDAFEGQKVGSAKVQSETTDVFTSLQTGEVGIVKIGSKSVKVVVR